MNILEDSTLDLIHRRRVRSSHPAYLIIFLVAAAAVALPAVRVDITATARGMVRPLEEPLAINCPVTGMVDSTILRGRLEVRTGDTLIWLSTDHLDAQIASHRRMIETNFEYSQDIRSILEEGYPANTSRYQQSYRNHRSGLLRLEQQEQFLLEEYRIAEQLYREDVISLYDFRKARTDYGLVRATVVQMRENYCNTLEEELERLRNEILRSEDEIDLLLSLSNDYAILAPAGGVIMECGGIKPGSVLNAGASLGVVSPLQNLVAECYLEPKDITLLKEGAAVRLRFDDPGFRSLRSLESRVEQIDRDVTMVQGRPFYRIHCPVRGNMLRFSDGTGSPIRSGMTFTAAVILSRQSLLSILLHRVERWAGPGRSSMGQLP